MSDEAATDPAAFMNPRPLELCVNPRPVDAVIATVWTYLCPGPIQTAVAGFLLYPSVLIAVNLNMVKAGPWPFATTVLGATLGLYVIFMGIELLSLAVRLRQRHTWRKSHFVPHRVVIGDEGLTASCDFDSQQIAWKDIRAVQSGFGYAFIRLRKLKIMPIRLRDFGSEADVRELVNRWQRLAPRRERFLAALGWLGVAGSLFIAVKIVMGLFASFTLDHQVQNGLRLARKLPPAIERFRIDQGRLPNSLAELSASLPDLAQMTRDVYDEPLHYDAHGEAFVLVSYGRDRRPDGRDYWNTREAGIVVRDASISRSHLACTDPDADLVVSDRGLHNACRSE